MADTRKCQCTDNEFRQIVAESLLVRQVLSRVGLMLAGSNYKTVQACIARLELNMNHFTGAPGIRARGTRHSAGRPRWRQFW